jgi:hypothetical protein
MKTSNRLLLAAIVITLGYLVAFDFSLKAEFLKGSFKGQFSNMKKLDLTNFNAVEHNAGNFYEVEIQQGAEYAVWINEDLADQVAITNHNKTLHIDYIGPNNKRHNFDHSIIIICPVITSVITHKLVPRSDLYGSQTKIIGFMLDTLNVSADRSTEITLNKNTINKLEGKISDSQGKLTINCDNKIKEAHFTVLGRSELSVLNPIIGKATYSYTDSATITVTGRALHLLQP